ncbi:hypothetical protein BGZ94_000471 [Podila epigama]|nr:hypothetical protein BGZ94_000471 [Podila epigama]
MYHTIGSRAEDTDHVVNMVLDVVVDPNTDGVCASRATMNSGERPLSALSVKVKVNTTATVLRGAKNILDPEMASIRRQLSELEEFKAEVTSFSIKPLAVLKPFNGIQSTPLKTDVEKAPLEFLIKEIEARAESLPLHGGNEATKSMVAATRLFKDDLYLMSQRQFSGRRGNGPVDFSVHPRKTHDYTSMCLHLAMQFSHPPSNQTSSPMQVNKNIADNTFPIVEYRFAK